MRIACIFNADRPGTTGGYIRRALEQIGIAADHWWLRDAEKIPVGYDLYLRIDHGDDYLLRLPQALRPCAFYVFDTHLPHSWKKIRKTASWYDLMVCCHRDAAERLKGALWLPVACDPQIHGPVPAVERERDIGFVGTEGGVPRKFILQALRERYPNSLIGQAPYDQMNVVYSRAKIGFNYSIAGDINMRVFEAMAAGALLITNALESGDLERLGLRDGEHFVFFRKPSEIFERIDHYLAHPEQARRIAEAGGAQARSKHTYQRRMEVLLQALKERL